MLALFVFALTLFGILRRPWKLPIWAYSTLGAGLALLFGLVNFADLRFIFHLIWDSTLTLVALMIITFALQSFGFFEWLIFSTLKIAQKFSPKISADDPHHLTIHARPLFVAICILSAFCSAVLANDGAILILTPLVLGLFLRAKNAAPAQLIAFLFAVSFVCDAASNTFIISNLSNIITAHYFHLGFADFARTMFAPNALGFLTALLLFLMVFRKTLKADLVFRAPAHPKLSGKLFAFYLCALVLFVASFFVSRRFEIPLSINSAIFAFFLLILLARKSPHKAWQHLKAAPFGIVLFSFGLFVVVFGLTKLNVQASSNAILSALANHDFLAVLSVGTASALGSSLFNNLPMVLFGNLMLGDFFAAHPNAELQNMLIYAHLLGCNIGAKLTPIGSLCTLLWLSLFLKKGLDFHFKDYLKLSIIFTFPALFAALLGLYFF